MIGGFDFVEKVVSGYSPNVLLADLATGKELATLRSLHDHNINVLKFASVSPVGSARLSSIANR